MAARSAMDDGDELRGEEGLRGQIVRLEARIDELSDRIESCQKFILAARIALVAGAILLAGTMFGAIRFDPRIVLGALAALLGGIVVWGSNGSTAKEAAAALAEAEADRAVLIGRIDLQVV